MAVDSVDTTPLLAEEGGMRHRSAATKDESEHAATTTIERPSDWDPNLPYGGKVYLARRKKPDPTHVRVIEVGHNSHKNDFDQQFNILRFSVDNLDPICKILDQKS